MVVELTGRTTRPTRFGPHTVYCDESGNSGSNFLDPDQPFYVVAGFSVQDALAADTRPITDFAEALGIEGEIHAVKALRRRGALRAVQRLIRDLGASHCIPLWAVMEKKYAIAGKVIETLLDPAFNDRVGNEYTYNFKMKQQLAGRVYLLPQDVLTQFARAYRELDPITMAASVGSLSTGLRTGGHDELARLLEGALAHLDENMRAERRGVEMSPTRAMASLNVPTLVSFCHMVAVLGETIGADFKIVHDNSEEFGQAYQYAFRSYADARPTEYLFPGGTRIILGFERLKSLTMADSKSSPWLQAADVLAAVIGRCLKAIYRREPLDADLKEIAKLTLTALLVEVVDKIKVAHIIASDETLGLIGDVIRS